MRERNGVIKRDDEMRYKKLCKRGIRRNKMKQMIGITETVT